MEFVLDWNWRYSAGERPMTAFRSSLWSPTLLYSSLISSIDQSSRPELLASWDVVTVSVRFGESVRWRLSFNICGDTIITIVIPTGEPIVKQIRFLSGTVSSVVVWMVIGTNKTWNVVQSVRGGAVEGFQIYNLDEETTEISTLFKTLCINDNIGKPYL